MSVWLQRAAFLLPRNGTTSHTVNPNTTTNLISGAVFSRKSGNYLLAILWGPSTNPTPTGWTSQVVGANTANGTLRVITRSAAGADTFSVTHAVTNMPMVVEIFEFSSTSAYDTSATQIDYNTVSTMPTLTPGTHTLLIAVQCNDYPAGYGYSNCTWGPGTGPLASEMLDIYTDTAGGTLTTGLWYSSAFSEDTTATSWAPTVTNDSTRDNRNDLVLSINAPNPFAKSKLSMMGIGI
ncbi:MAG: hypothetical protein EOT05_00440 [Candidatus Microsaccharimonas sossegonensis]|uniref:Uncharacterized protein n=1 Tax=Candidatus Microsaccharimonas sossegonensis TaxID=2506948 RepID=A0A4Q0AGM4_9BACT|nr:MAG: hypothetical protein EOT05_00440 [Candidatus Microsaccharimonas sossegonensis]